MSNSNFYSPESIRPLYGEVIPAYQAAFAGEPWFEVSKCNDKRRRCVGGLSKLVVGSLCEVCGTCPTRPAYEPSELIERFENIAATRPTKWYAERPDDEGVTMAAIAWKAKPGLVAQEKYADVPEMAPWLDTTLGSGEIGWLDEVFANKALRRAGNLNNFGTMCSGFMEYLDTDVLAYRTLNERMIAATQRDFPGRSQVFERQVPDWREFVVIRSES